MPTSSSDAFVAQLYQNILLRPGSTGEIDYWAGQLDSGPLTNADLAAVFANSPEAQTEVMPIVRLYEGFLGRTPDAPGLAFWVNEYRTGTSLDQIALGIEQSAAYQATHTISGSPATIVQDVFNAVMPTHLDATGQQYWTNYATQFAAAHAGDANLNGELTAASTEQFVNSSVFLGNANAPNLDWLEFVGQVATYTTYSWIDGNLNLPSIAPVGTPSLLPENVVEQLYQTILARPGSASEIASWTTSDYLTPADVASLFANSTEAQTEIVPIVRLFQGFLDRTPDAAELYSAASQYRGGVTLDQIALGIQQSPEFQAAHGTDTPATFIADLFQNVLGRAPDVAGLQYWTSYATQFTTAHAADVNVNGELQAALVSAFVSSPEFVGKAALYDTAWLTAVGELNSSASYPSTGGIIDGPVVSSNVSLGGGSGVSVTTVDLGVGSGAGVTTGLATGSPATGSPAGSSPPPLNPPPGGGTPVDATPQAFSVTGHPAGTTSSGHYTLTLITSPVAGDTLTFANAATESWVGGTTSGAPSQVNVAPTTSVAQALDLAAEQAASNAPGGLLPAATGLYDWFQWGGNTYIVEAINNAATPAPHTALAAADAIVELIGLVNLNSASANGHTLIL